MTLPFVHLHVHTQYSLLDGAIRIEQLLKRAANFGMDTVAITDHGTMFGVLDFYEQAVKAGIKPIIGCEFYLAPRRLSDKDPQIDGKNMFHLVLLAKNYEGYQNLCRLATIAQLEGFYYRPRIDKEVLKQHSQGLIALSACLHGEIPAAIADGKIRQAEESAQFYLDMFGQDNFFLEIQKNGIPLQEKVNRGLIDLSSRMSIPLVATNDCHYLDKHDVRAHDVLLCIQTGKTIQDTDRLHFKTDQLYFKSKEQMYEDFKHTPDALENTVEIAKRCNVEFKFNTYHFPRFETSDGQTVDSVFEQKVRDGFSKRMEAIRLKKPDIDEKPYIERLEYEIRTIRDMKFPGYFLIVADFINYAKENNVPVGPGRGSAAGSLVAYSLGITDLDPLEHELIFERFLNPARISMPDIDVDFCMNGRENVFKYVMEKYGGGEDVNAYVGQIITFGKLKTRAVIRDVGRALNIPLREVDAIAKMVPDVLNISLDEALKREPKLAELAKNKQDIGELIQICRVLEGLPRHASTHAAGVVIGDRPLVEYMPLYKGKKDEVVTQFDMKWVEKIGLVKFDFLGLRNLTVIEDTLKLIRKQHGTAPDISNLNLDDPDTYRLLSAGDTSGVFQLESSGMKELLVRMKPANFGDLTALVALYRPGPLESGMVDDFVERRHGRKPVKYILPELEPILKETYGVIVYQEQVMKIAGVLANYSMAEADGLRKAMGKKIASMMAEHRNRFVKGAVENNVLEAKAKQIYDLMETFGGYGFNKSHSAAYALISYQTAYLKAHYPLEFMASLLTSEMHAIDGVVKYIAECRNHSIKILPPDVNESEKGFIVSGSGIRFGLLAVKNVGENAIESIIETRKQGKFISLFDFCERVDLRKLNKRVIESLIKCGAFDSTGHNRAQMIAALEDALDYGQRVQKEKIDPQMGLFDVGQKREPINMPTMPNIEELDEKEKLAWEKESLGFYITGHPLSRFESLLEKYTNANTLTIRDKNDGDMIKIGGIVTAVKVIQTKKGANMAFITTEDMHGTIETTVFTSIYESSINLLVADSAILIRGKLEKDENTVRITADEIIALDVVEEKWTANISIKLDITKIDREKLILLKEIFTHHPGSCPAYLHLINPDISEIRLDVSDAIKLKPCNSLTHEVNSLLGYNALEIKEIQRSPL